MLTRARSRRLTRERRPLRSWAFLPGLLTSRARCHIRRIRQLSFGRSFFRSRGPFRGLLASSPLLRSPLRGLDLPTGSSLRSRQLLFTFLFGSHSRSLAPSRAAGQKSQQALYWRLFSAEYGSQLSGPTVSLYPFLARIMSGVYLACDRFRFCLRLSFILFSGGFIGPFSYNFPCP